MDLDQDSEELELKKKARRRLVGAVALVLAVVILVPMLLDDERRPLSEDVEIVRSSGERISLKSAEEPQPVIEGQEDKKTLEPREKDIDQVADANSSVSVVGDQVAVVSKYFVQLGVFSNFERAQIYAKKVEKNKFEVVSRKLEGASKPLMTILVGPFSDKEGAEQALKRLVARKLTYGDAKIVEFE